MDHVNIRDFLSTSAQAGSPQTPNVAERELVQPQPRAGAFYRSNGTKVELLVGPAVDKKGRVTAQCNSIKELTDLHALAVSGEAKGICITKGKGGVYQAKYKPVSGELKARSLTKLESKSFKNALIELTQTHKSVAEASQKEQMIFALNLGRKLEFDRRPEQITPAEWQLDYYTTQAKVELSSLFALVNEKKALSVGQAMGLIQFLKDINESIGPNAVITARFVKRNSEESLLQLTYCNRQQGLSTEVAQLRVDTAVAAEEFLEQLSLQATRVASH